MLRKKTVLILGAGASCPYGFPTGTELRKKIIYDYSSIVNSLNDRGIEHNKANLGKEFQDFATTFKASGTQSIDLYLSQREDTDIMLGKVLIFCIIRNCEHTSKFNEDIYFIDKNKRIEKDIDWYRLFFFKLVSGVTCFDEINFDMVEIITFNYDRSFEFYLYQSLRNWFPVSRVTDDQLLSLIHTLRIHHVFGTVTDELWPSHNNNFINIKNRYHGFDCSGDEAFNKINLLKVINEIAVDEENRYKKIIESADNVFFLGFGYLEENMKILGSPFMKKSNSNPKFFGTCLGKTLQQIVQIKAHFQLPYELVRLFDVDCYGLLADYLV